MGTYTTTTTTGTISGLTADVGNTTSSSSYYTYYVPKDLTVTSDQTWITTNGTVTVGNSKVVTEEDFNPVKEELDRMKPLKENKVKENKNMNLNFGVINETKGVRLSPYGIAIQNRDNRWVSFNAKDRAIVDVESFSMSPKNMLYMIPVAIKEIEIGDTIIHNSMPMFVTGISAEDGKFYAIDPYAGEEVTILPTKNMFGFNYITKIISLLDLKGQEPSDDNPFGDILPFLMMGNGDFNPMMYLLLNKDKKIDKKTLMAIMMCGKGSNENMLPLMMMLDK